MSELDELRRQLAASEASRNRLLGAARDIVAVIDAHEIDSLDCDRSGEKCCDCLENATRELRAAIAAEPSATTTTPPTTPAKKE